VLDELVACKTTSLGKAVHAFADFEEDAAVDDEVGEFVFFDDNGWEKGDRHPHVFLAFHGGVEIEILGVGAHSAGVWRRDGAVDEQFDSSDLRARGGGDALVVDKIATDGPAHATRIGFLAAVGDDGAKTGGCATWWQLRGMDELAGVGTSDFRATDAAIGKATDLVDVGLNMLRSFGPKNEVAVLEGLASVGVDDGVDELVAVAIVGAYERGVVAVMLALGGLVLSFQAGGVSVTAGWSVEVWRRLGFASRGGPASGLGAFGAG
jgi:hypothetical protein